MMSTVAVFNAVYETVDRAVYNAVCRTRDRAANKAVYGAVYVTLDGVMYRAVGWAVFNAMTDGAAHPALSDFLASAGDATP